MVEVIEVVEVVEVVELGNGGSDGGSMVRYKGQIVETVKCGIVKY